MVKKISLLVNSYTSSWSTLLPLALLSSLPLRPHSDVGVGVVADVGVGQDLAKMNCREDNLELTARTFSCMPNILQRFVSNQLKKTLEHLLIYSIQWQS